MAVAVAVAAVAVAAAAAAAAAVKAVAKAEAAVAAREGKGREAGGWRLRGWRGAERSPVVLPFHRRGGAPHRGHVERRVKYLEGVERWLGDASR